MNRNIIIWPDSMLRRACEPVQQVDDDVRRLLNDMTETMISAQGAGLAAPQVGFALRLVTILVETLDPQPGLPVTNQKREVVRLVNPRIVDRSSEMISTQEGCLSVPGIRAAVSRHKWVRVAALDEKGAKIELEGDGMLAIALQHELDHLDGKVFVDQLSQLKRDVLSKKFIKAKKAGMRYVFPQPEPQDFTAAPN